MKTLTLATLLIVFYMGLSITSTIPELDAPNITFGRALSQNCPEDITNADAEVIFFELIAVEHPLGPNTCGDADFHSVPSAGIDPSNGSSVNIRYLEKD